jgi:hypothetical protein
MRIQSLTLRPLLLATLLVSVLAVPTVAQADTIYLKNGRVIRTPSAKQIGDRVEFVQFGETVTIPASVVLRIEKDDREEAPRLPTAEEDRERAEVPAEDAGEGEAAEEELPPDKNPDYWRDRITAIQQEKDQIAESMVELRREERAFLFSHRSTAATREKIEAAQARDAELDQELIDLRREARRLGVPAGWLRVREGATGS